ncbi:hypothetical protein ACFFU9_01545 [Mariniflexile ostreae]|uniref:Lipoprotein n=1 Tax=Mariniflexile ostreae TaxID=1520892 RepID=A0ABV5F7J9_9FLAO
MKQIMIFILLVTFCSCATKIPLAEKVRAANDYVAGIDANNDLETTRVNGVLTDVSGVTDTGQYVLEYYYNTHNNLFRIKNIETTDKVVVENFYFKNKQLIFITSETASASLKKLYISKGKIINESEVDAAYGKILLNKAKMFQKDFKKISK